MTLRPLLVLALVATALAGPAIAAERPQPTAEQKAQWNAMTPEQRQAKMQERHAQREANMTPEQKAARAARRAEWQAMTDEQRAAKRAEMQARRGQRGGHRRQ